MRSFPETDIDPKTPAANKRMKSLFSCQLGASENRYCLPCEKRYLRQRIPPKTDLKSFMGCKMEDKGLE